MFLHLSVILFTGGGVADTNPLEQLPRADTPPGADTPSPGADTPSPWSRRLLPRSRHPPPAQCIMGGTGNKWAVRILLECMYTDSF